MRILIIVLPFLFIILLTSGCAGFFEQEIELDELPYERRLVLNTILSPQDSLIRADVFVTAPAVGDLPPDYPSNGIVREARVILKSPSGSFPLEFEQTGSGSTYVLRQTEVQMETGQTYEVTAEWDGLTARGQTTIPDLGIPRASIELTVVNGDQEQRIFATWPNQTGELDYYHLFVDETPQRGIRGNLQRATVDYIYGRDALGSEITSDNIGPPSGGGRDRTLNVCQTTQATYEYLLTRGILIMNDENPFAEPTAVANNLQEGIGLVGASNCWQIQL